MRCPGCGLYHPPQYEQCVSCGENLGTAAVGGPDDAASPHADRQIPKDGAEESEHHVPRRSKVQKQGKVSSIPTMVGIMVALSILLISAGATVFFLTKPGDDDLLFQQAQKELANGQYAFAVKSLEKLSALRPADARVFLTLARAYVGVDQVDKAWAAISQAQQLGSGVVAEPALASDLVNYYRQREQYDKAIELLRPLAQANIPGKRAELADLDALWGDEALRDGDLERSLRCWEEVRDIREGTRFTEAESRLATIYQKLANKLIAEKDDTQALAYLTKLATIAENATYYERAGDIYERRGQLELAIDQYRKAIALPSKSIGAERRLASLMARRGKELLDQGDTQAGYGYLQEARALDPLNTLPSVTARSVTVSVEPGSHLARIAGEVWNPGPQPVKLLTIKVELYSTRSQRVLWEREQKIIDEFVPPLNAEESKPFDMIASLPVRLDEKPEFRLYLDGGLYKSYTIGSTPGQAAGKTGGAGEPASDTAATAPALRAPQADAAAPPIAPPASAVASPPAPEDKPEHPEDKTLKDLEF